MLQSCISDASVCVIAIVFVFVVAFVGVGSTYARDKMRAKNQMSGGLDINVSFDADVCVREDMEN
jgi:hypothetical protein